MDGDHERPPVACTITEERAAERADWMRTELLPRYAGAEGVEDGATVRFEGVDETLRYVARFVAEEKECCAFADYRIEISPPYGETRLTVTGPEGTEALFGGALVDRLEEEVPPERPG